MYSPDLEEQENELLALDSIYSEDEGVFEYQKISENNHQDRFVGQIAVYCVLEDSKLNVGATQNERLRTAVLSRLPALYLNFTLPKDYPSSSAPEFTINAVWITNHMKSILTERLESVWLENEGCAVLFMWIQMLQDELPALVPQNMDLDEICTELPGPYNAQQLFNMLVDFDHLARMKQFQKDWHLCCVCFEEKSGKECMEFTPCDHVFCIECVRQYFRIQVTEGNVRQLECLSGQCDSVASPQQVKSILNDDTLYNRYESLLLSQTLDLMSDIVPCPRPACQQPVIVENTEETRDPMGSCPSCDFIFCTYCRRVYHGVAPCPFTLGDKRRIVTEYQSGGPQKRRLMERRFGKETLKRLVEDSLAETWIGENSKRCPCCKVNIEKRDGCNKMWCSKCDTSFCWLCRHVLNSANPYAHFNNPSGGACYNQLFAGTMEAEAEAWMLNRR